MDSMDSMEGDSDGEADPAFTEPGSDEEEEEAPAPRSKEAKAAKRKRPREDGPFAAVSEDWEQQMESIVASMGPTGERLGSGKGQGKGRGGKSRRRD